MLAREKIRKKRCKAAFSYAPQNDDELELKVGDIIEVSRESRVVLSLAGCTASLLTARALLISFLLLFFLPADIKDSTGSESDGGDSCSTKSDGGSVTSASEIQPKKVKGIGFGDIFKDKAIKLRPRSMDVDSELGTPSEKSTARKVPSSAGPQEPVKADSDSRAKATAKEYCKVTFPYEAQNEDELTIKEGDVVAIISKDCADAGWWRGELGGRRGVFPDNFVKLLPPDVEKERPKKPPPPAAPSGRQTPGKCLSLSPAINNTAGHSCQGLAEATGCDRVALSMRTESCSLIAHSSLSSSDLADSPPPEEDKHEKDRGREGQDSPSPKPYEAGKRAPRPIQVLLGADLKAGLPPKPAAPAPALSSSGGGNQSALHPGGAATGHRPNSPSHIGHEAKPKNDRASHSQQPLEELRSQVMDLRAIIDLMKSQHK
ncbi:UNVERIFIED_CONTAM: hypothetical protein FKN15_003933 [Acipenser sinensis]